MALPLDNPARHYAWGSTDAIPRLLGLEETGQPIAEVWLGAHPLAPSLTSQGPLDVVIAAQPASLLGRGHSELPFLMKVLSAATPLSIQAHPSREQAVAGYAEEQAAGIPPNDPARSFKDRNHKPELIYALGDFAALSGFRPAAEGRALLAWLHEHEPRPLIAEALAILGGEEAESRRLAAVSALILGHAEEAGLIADDWARSLAGAELPAALLQPGGASPLETLRETQAAYPGDPGILMALLLNRVDLVSGQVLSTGARTLHAYLHGDGIEVMAASDNVLRGGLTSKHVDIGMLLEIGDFAPSRPEVLEPEQREGAAVFHGAAEEVALTVYEHVGPGAALPAGPLIALCLEGAFTLDPADSAQGLGPGESAFVPADASRALAGSGRLFVSHLQAP